MKDFYVGYLPKAPDDLRRFVRRVIIFLGSLAIALALLLVFAQGRFAASVFEFGNNRTLEGTISTKPYPELLVTRPGAAPGKAVYSRYLLVAPGKHGADDLLANFEGHNVRLQGQLIYRDGLTMVEVVPGSIVSVAERSADSEPVRDLGAAVVSGEIVDSKCYLGVMNPGNGKVHRDCASRCISGGIPPLFISNSGRGEQYLLVGSDGKALSKDALRDFIAEPITIRGEVLQQGERLLLEVDPRTLSHTPDGLQTRLAALAGTH